jgi:arsenite methyltransferase
MHNSGIRMKIKRADYGIDAPETVRNYNALGGIALLAGLIIGREMVLAFPYAARILAIIAFVFAFCSFATAGLLLWSSKYAKVRQREFLIDTLELAGNEKVLDVGCGRGLLLNGVARRLPKGRAFGIDLWQTVDQSGNSAEAALANAKAENVADRVEVKTADMRELSFPDGSMDAVISSIAIHNVPDEDGRAKAIKEIARVLKPGGRLAIQDFRATGEYIKTLRDMGWKEVELSGLNFLIFPPIRIVTGRKP